ncbi:ATP-binding cassette domain-containing protein [Romboutsia sp.]|uniref:ATP-binding cassette domain-containing protein n=1 Tax=Romboutsia sp. TaxID=1965302 RepID=UPI003F2D24CF
MAFIELNKVNFSYIYNENKVLNNINLKIKKGELVLIIGPSGSGKSTLISLLKEEIRPLGNLEGNIKIDNKSIDEHSFKGIEYLNQNASDKSVNAINLFLSSPKILMLEEPTCIMDSNNYDKIINVVLKLKKESKMTTIITDYKYDDIFYLADKIVFLKDGEILLQDSPERFIEKVYKENIVSIILFLKQVDSLYNNVSFEDRTTKKSFNKPIRIVDEVPVFEVNKLNVAYKKNILKLNKINFKTYYSEIISIVGINNSSKNPFLKLIDSMCCPFIRSVKIDGKKCRKIKNNLWKNVDYIPEDADYFFSYNTVIEEFKHLKKKLKEEFDEELYENIKKEYDLERILERQLIEVSRGEKQLLATIIQLLKKPKVVILNEPTKGLDPILKEKLGNILLQISKNGTSIILLCNDKEFIYEYSHKCCRMINNKISIPEDVENFFDNKSLLKSQSLKMAY